jgi:predicted amidophosphoribosyltransferase
VWAALLELLIPSVCPGCDAPRRAGSALLCAECAGDLSPLAQLGGAHTALAYRGTALRLLRRFKYEGRRDALAVLLELCAARLRGLDVEGIVPVPRHADRVRELRADPVHLLARQLARRLALPLWDDCLRRTRPTPPQTSLPLEARRTSPFGSFAARADSLRGRRVLLLDDVTTSGATLRAAGDALAGQAGALRVEPAALAGTLWPAPAGTTPRGRDLL